MSQTKPPITLTDRVRGRTRPLLGRLGRWLHRRGVHPNAVSVTGFLIVSGGAVAAGAGWLVLAGWLIAFGSLMDALDGAVARARGGSSRLGALLDSTLDRYADGFIFCALSYHFAQTNQENLMLLPLAALVGSFAVSYVRARADGPDVCSPVKSGGLTRFERLVILIVALWFHNWLLVPGLWLLAVGTHITAVQRLWTVRKNIVGE